MEIVGSSSFFVVAEAIFLYDDGNHALYDGDGVWRWYYNEAMDVCL
jgi:hypothetical protein